MWIMIYRLLVYHIYCEKIVQILFGVVLSYPENYKVLAYDDRSFSL